MKGAINPGLFKFSLLEAEYKTIISETQKLGSITPRTHKSREIPEEQDNLYIDKYEHKGSTVTHYAIDALKVKINIDNSEILNERVEVIKADDVASSRSSNKFTLDDVKKIKHHLLEKEVLNKALNYLMENYNSSVLVDIFTRANNQIKIDKIKNSDDYIPEVHTVILYKNPSKDGKHEILVIDPSNFTFSSHLSNSDIEFKHEAFNKITTLHKGIQIYKPEAKPGPNNNQYRDCTDIAVKLAFGLNMINWTSIDLKSITELNIVKALSNDESIDTSFAKKFFSVKKANKNVDDKLTIRIKQTSDIEIVNKFYESAKIIDETLKPFKAYFPEKTFTIHLEKYKEILTDYTSNNLTILNKLIQYNHSSIEMLTNALDEEHTKLSGIVLTPENI